MRKEWLFLIVFTCLAGLAFLWYQPDDNLHLVFCDVGQGDAILVWRGKNQILIDGGDGQQILDCLGKHMPFWDRTIEMVVLTHPEKDHAKGLISVAERYHLLYFVSGVLGSDADYYQKLLAVIGEQEVHLINPWQDDEMTLGGINFEFYWPTKQWVKDQLSGKGDKTIVFRSSKDNLDHQTVSEDKIIRNIDLNVSPNDFSLIFRLSFNDFDVLFTGDADNRIQPEVLSTVKMPKVDVLKVAHHGSKYAFTDQFLAQTEAKLAVILVGKNPWGHPTPELLKQLEKFNMMIKRTDQDGTIEIISDGSNWK